MDQSGAPAERRIRAKEIDIAALFAALLIITVGAASWRFLNADGVSYLDLAGAARAGDWTSFVQGYWSPLYPLLLAAAGALTAHDRTGILAVAHEFNVLVALAGVALIWKRFGRLESPIPARLALAAWFLCSARPPRVEALTPDLLLTLLILALALELTGARRPFRLGVLLGVIFLAKTSSWPWIIIVLGLEAWRVRGVSAALLRTALTAFAVTLLWIVPLSIKSGTPTIETAGALNACWYLRQCDSRSPDTHEGTHRAYRETSVGETTLRWADVSSTRWTYAPWGDPSAWAAGVGTQSARTPSVWTLLSYSARQLGVGLIYWLWPVILGVLLPALLMRSWNGWRLAERDGPALVVATAGLIGTGQFFLIHAEPRLIGPYVMCLAVGVIALCVPDSPAAPAEASGKKSQLRNARRVRDWRFATALSYAGYLIAVPLAVFSVIAMLPEREDLASRAVTLTDALAPLRQAGISRPRVVLIGYAFPALADAWRANVRIVAQVRPSSAAELAKLPDGEQQRLTAMAFGGAADVVWLVDAEGRFRMRSLVK